MSSNAIDLVFVGGGGFFLELYDYLEADISSGALKQLTLKGFLDKKEGVDRRPIQHLGAVDSYTIEPNDRFLICVGDPNSRERLFQALSERGARFFTYVHNTAVVSRTATLGNGAIVCPFAIVNSDARVEDNACLNVHTSVGHEAVVGQSSTLSPYAALNGNSEISSRCFLGTRATVFPGIHIGAQTTIDSHSYVKQHVGERKIVSNVGIYQSVDNRFLRE